MNTTYYVLSLVCVVGIIWGIKLMNSPKTAKQGNLLGAVSLFAAVILTLYNNGILDYTILWVGMVIGGLLGYFMAIKVTMLQIPQMVALLNGLGGGASALVALMILTSTNNTEEVTLFSIATAVLALVVGGVTFSGSAIAALKLDQRISQRPVRLKGHSVIMGATFITLCFILVLMLNASFTDRLTLTGVATALSLFLGIIFTIRVGGADMPITISLLNSLSGLAGAIAGFAIYDPLLVAVGGIVGAAGLILTQVMCRGMNRSLFQVLGGNTVIAQKSNVTAEVIADDQTTSNQLIESIEVESIEDNDLASVDLKDSNSRLKEILEKATNVVIVPGYGMALAQAQFQVKSLYDNLSDKGKDVKFAIHPVAGRMPGHMNVLLAEVDVPYDKLYELETINDEFSSTDLVIVVGANDVVNPAANTAEDTPIYGMPILEVSRAENIIICNWDTNPGYAGVPNTLYQMDKVILKLGDAKETIAALDALVLGKGLNSLVEEKPSEEITASSNELKRIIDDACNIVIVPGYGMALAQAQYQVKSLYDRFVEKGKEVRFAIHPVAGRMPGHMNVLLAEVDIPYDKLYELETINDEFSSTDLVIVVGANDVVNPAANTAEDTPIYGMPILEVSRARNIIICNWDTNPGYAGVPNTLYEMSKVILKLGDAKETITSLEAILTEEEAVEIVEKNEEQSILKKEELESDDAKVKRIIEEASKVIVVPGYGMALAQAQYQVKTLYDSYTEKGKDVCFAIHPVAGRMPGHMNVLLAEVDIPYDKLYELDAINDDFGDVDLVIVIGANDVINPAANTAQDTPIYGMPILEVYKAKNIIICNYDTKPGYAGVPNTLYEMEKAILRLGDAKETVAGLI